SQCSPFSFSSSASLPALRSFPARRSSDLGDLWACWRGWTGDLWECWPGLAGELLITAPRVVPGTGEPAILEPGYVLVTDGRVAEIGRAHVLTPVTWPSRMPSSA